jgi:hypothetical protein
MKEEMMSNLKKVISHIYLNYWIHEEFSDQVLNKSRDIIQNMTKPTEMKSEEFFNKLSLEACKSIVAFHQNKNKPDEKLVKELHTQVLNIYEKDNVSSAFLDCVRKITESPGRVSINNRIQPKKGCKLCKKPCGYGFFVLIGDPDFSRMGEVLKKESEKPVNQQIPIITLWAFAQEFFQEKLDASSLLITPEHLGNLCYCLLTIGTSKSRYDFPEKQMKSFQEVNQSLISHWEQ